MGAWGIGHWIVVLFVILVVFGAGRLPHVMGDMAKGVRAFKKGLNEEHETGEAAPPPTKDREIAKNG